MASSNTHDLFGLNNESNEYIREGRGAGWRVHDNGEQIGWCVF